MKIKKKNCKLFWRAYPPALTKPRMNMNMNNPNMNMNFGATSRVGGGVVPVTGRRRPMRTELTDEQKAEIREAFEIFDMDKDGALDFHEFKVKLGY